MSLLVRCAVIVFAIATCAAFHAVAAEQSILVIAPNSDVEQQAGGTDQTNEVSNTAGENQGDDNKTCDKCGRTECNAAAARPSTVECIPLDPPNLARLRCSSGKVCDAFECLEAPSHVETCQSVTATPTADDTCCENPTGTDCPEGNMPSRHDCTRLSPGRDYSGVFSGPAHFATGYYGSHPGPASVIIYEGMSIHASKDGEYDLYCLVECPSTPVTLRLQLKIKAAETWPGTITLPPIQLAGDSAGGNATMISNDGRTTTWKIRHTGYSYVLQHYLKQQSTCTNGCCTPVEILRAGTVRVGQVPERSTTY